MKAAVGQIVHYVSYGTPGGEYASQCRAAVITEEHDAALGKLGLCVLNPSGIFFADPVFYLDPESQEGRHRGGTWHWPERVD